jgi:hypothetical protein
VDRMFSKNSQGNYYWFTKAWEWQLGLYITLCVWIEPLRQNRLGWQTGQATGRTTMDRTWIESKKNLWVRCRAGEYCNGGREGVVKQYRDRKYKHEW